MKNIVKKIIVIALTTTLAFSLPSLTADAKGRAKAKLSSAVFDANYYYSNNPDLQTALGNDEAKLYDHYVNYGLKEGRSGSSEFNVLVYKNNYPDLVVTYGDDLLSYCYHYMNNGKAEGRVAAGEAIPLNASSNSVITSSTVAQTIVPLADSNVVTSGNVLGTYTTYYDGTISRATNVSLAASRINGTVLEPGASFSFSTAVLPRTKENGYVVANVFANGKVAKGIGGGICQVSSTLYAALLNAGIPATERYPHSLPVSYMPTGMDATISGTSKDLKFSNTLSYPIQIHASANNDTGTLTVYLAKYEK